MKINFEKFKVYTSISHKTAQTTDAEGLIETNVRKIKILNEEEIKKIAKG